MYYIVCYDTPSPKRGRKILKITRNYLRHVQKSVLEGFLQKNDFNEMYQKVKKIMCDEEDSVRIFIIPDEIYFRTKIIGHPPITENEKFIIV